MYCVIQKIQNKKANKYGAYKELQVYESTWTIDGVTKTSYGYSYGEDRFERPIRDVYKISIHKSYREDGKVKKHQWVICTMGYYDMLDFSPYDFISNERVKDLAGEMKITEEQFWDMIYKKYDPLRESIEKEFQETEEYKTHKKHSEIIDKYCKDKNEFEQLYGEDTYDYCYDVFGTLRNEDMLNKVKRDYEAKQSYYNSSYQENYYDNYKDYFSSYSREKHNTYTEEEKAYLKTIYKAAAMKLHPDKNQDNGEGMKFLNQLKDEWGI